MELPKSYDASSVEDAIYQKWLDSGYFNPDNLPVERDAERFTVMLPPLNVTGTLHMGHAFEDTIQDTLIRFHRMQGKKTLWLPGTDHAAIATQAKVESELVKKEEKNRHDLGREEFLKRVNEFAQESHDIIAGQLKKMGASVDWSREAYTLDETRSRAVKIAFKRLFDLGLVYRGLRIINWDPKGQTTISDDEIVREDRPGKLYTFKYSKDFPIAISTSRPETKVGDTAVAVHPSDTRYQEYIGKEYDVEFFGCPLHIRIVSDESVDPEFGTGALGVTPAHSLTDWEIAQKNNLGAVQVIDERGKMLVDHPELKAKKIAEARELIVEWLKAQDLLEKEEDIVQSMALSERTKAVIEPLPKEQWFVDVNREFVLPHSEIQGIESGEVVTLKRLMRQVVETGQVKILPEHCEKIYLHWIDNLRDWCISRQLWFGHRIPAWTGSDVKTLVVHEQRIFLARHAECEDNAVNILARPESPLTEIGQDQCKKLADDLREKQITKIYCSDFARSKQTAELVAQELGLDSTNIETLEDLREIHVGELIGQTEDLRLHGFAQAQKTGTGESLGSIEMRVRNFMSFLESRKEEGSVLVIGHGGLNAVIEAHLQGRRKEDYVHYRTQRGNIPNASWTELLLAVEPKGLSQDEDTFDTWFSSGLWTFTTLGWPNQTMDLQEFHPTTVINPGYEIIQLWIARMILMSTTLTGQIPFKTAFIHGLVRDSQGRKFSKSLNNGVNPLEMTEKYGTDALRMALIYSTAPTNDVAFDEQRVKGMKHFANKLWNIARFIITNLEMSAEGKGKSEKGENNDYSHLWGRPETLTEADTQILTKLDALINETTTHLENFRLHEASQGLYQFVWYELADVYLEASKEQLDNRDLRLNTEKMLYYCLITVLKLLHPFMPFVTEHIASLLTEQGMRKEGSMLLVSKWPEV